MRRAPLRRGPAFPRGGPAFPRGGPAFLRLTVALACVLAGQGAPAAAGTSGRETTSGRDGKPPKVACRTVEAPGLLVLNEGCGLPTVLYAHAANESESAQLRPDLLAAVAAAGYSVVMTDMCGLLNWGSPCAVDALRQARLRYSPDKPVRVLAVSMGGAGLLNYAASHPDDVLLAVGIVPVTTWDTDWLRRAAPGASPLPDEVRFPYRIFSARDDEVVGRPVLRGGNVDVRQMGGTHDLWQSIDPEVVVKALRS